MFNIKRLTVQGFRGFAARYEFSFENPVIILYGGNHRGKSSTLNAIEWSLFGDESIGKGTTIRERINWLVPNRNMANIDVCVELDLRDERQQVRVRRTMKKTKAHVDRRLELRVDEADPLIDDEAEKKLVQRLGTSFRDFMTTTYLHQEAIRDILTQEPRQRNDAIDRLLGLADFNNLLAGIKDVQLSQKQKSLGAAFKEFEGRIETILRTRQADIDRARHLVKDAGLSDLQLTPEGGVAAAIDAVASLEKLAGELGLSYQVPRIPADWSELGGFGNSVKEDVVRLRSELPDIEEQSGLQMRKARISQLQVSYDQAREALEQAGKDMAILISTTGDAAAVQLQLADTTNLLRQEKDKLRDTGERTELVQAGIKLLEKADTAKLGGKCPLCHNPAADLLTSLKAEWETELKQLAGHIQDKIASLERQQQALVKALENLQKAKNTQESKQKSLEESRSTIGEFFGRSLAADEDPAVLLKAQLKEIDQRMEQLGQALKGRQIELTAVEKKLERLGQIVSVLAAERKVETIQQIEKSREFQELEVIRDRCATFVEDVEQIAGAVTGVLGDEAKTKIASASQKIQDYFRRIADHPALQAIQVVVESKKTTGQNDYRFCDDQQLDITPILSQGDYNALALAIFLGLGAASGDSGKFDFLMLDDPSQSLAPEQQQRLVKVLDEVGACRHLIISTMDKGFHELLTNGLSRMKKTYEYSAWTLAEGPTILVT